LKPGTILRLTGAIVSKDDESDWRDRKLLYQH